MFVVVVKDICISVLLSYFTAMGYATMNDSERSVVESALGRSFTVCACKFSSRGLVLRKILLVGALSNYCAAVQSQ
jgi:hypothetical protein